MQVLRMVDLPLAGRRVLIREDLNVPIRDGAVASDARLTAALPSIEFALKQGARVILMSHLGRPEEGRFDEALSLRPVARRLGELLGRPVALVDSWAQGVEVEPGQAALLENVRFERGEKADDTDLAARMAALCDIFVMDAFGSAHRAHASTHGVARLAPVACAGPLLVRELEALAAALEQPRAPTVAIVGGSKVSTKLGVLQTLAGRMDALILGGGIANTLLAAAGHRVGRSLHEPEMLEFARRLLDGEFGAADIPLPSDVVVAESLDETTRGSTRGVDEVGDGEMILDIGPETAAEYAGRLHRAGTILWNGPVGVFEHSEFACGTEAISKAVASSGAFSIAGGGDTLAAIQQFGVGDGVSYLSTGGGAFLEFLEGRELPAVEVLKARASANSRN
ncbi:MAG: phosphoglycerate kinase [Rhodospirillaceae bacterium]|nr:phosphoglycerate kinase [Rhodospirillaceae bacterium]